MRPGASSGGRINSRAKRVRLVPGWFNETIGAFRAGLEAAGASPRIGLLHVDCDLYTSAVEVLFGLADYLKPGAGSQAI